MAQQHKPTPAAAAATAVTARTSFSFGASELFAVQAGVPLSAAMDDLSLLIGTAQAAARQVAVNAESCDDPGAAWAPVYLLEMAHALQCSIHSGLLEAQRADEKGI